MIGAPPRQAIRSLPLEHVESLALGHVLFEMCAADTDLALITDLPAVYSQVRRGDRVRNAVVKKTIRLLCDENNFVR